jgi:murein DD-endopeptidase MepM/ murein hydrolase activator NlpD
VITKEYIRFLQGFIVVFMGVYQPAFSQSFDLTKTYASPVDTTILLSSNYGEIRESHFHSGIDILADEGSRVFAVKEGYVSRISITLRGYGKALYVTHPNGYTSVYGHLSKFDPEIEKYIRDLQYQKHKYAVDIRPPANKFRVQQGQCIALSGNTGYSFGSHLHFELRITRGDIPLNVLKHGIVVPDKRKPRISCLGIYPLNDHALVSGQASKIIIPFKTINSNVIKLSDTVAVWGKTGFGIETYDYLDGRENACSPFTVSLGVDGRPVFSFNLDSIPFEKSSYINSHIDYAEKVNTGRKIQKLYLDPNNRLDIYKDSLHKGICMFTDSLDHAVTIVSEDAAGNKTTLSFTVKSKYYDVPASIAADTTKVAHFYYDSLNVFETNDIRIVIPIQSLFTTVDFHYRSEKAADTLFSDLHYIDNETTPLNKPIIISVKPVNLPHTLVAKAALVQIGKNNQLIYQGGQYSKGFVTGKLGNFGTIAIAVDTVAPVIKPLSFAEDQKFTESRPITFIIRDNLSGINTFNGFIDNKWALFEYDAKNNLLFYIPDASRISKNEQHSLELIVTDNKNNICKFKGHFFY